MAAFIRFERAGAQEDVWVNPWHVCSVYLVGNYVGMRLHSGQEIVVDIPIEDVIKLLQEP
jgi:hypothetical protein